MKEMGNKLRFFIFICSSLLLTACFRQSGREADRSTRVDFNASQQTFQLHSIEDLYAVWTYNVQSYPLISAPRGGPGVGFRENAVETVDRVTPAMPAIRASVDRASRES